MNDNILAESVLTRVTVNSTSGVHLDSGEMAYLRQFRQLSSSALRKIADQEGRSQLIVDTYKKNAGEYKSTIVFCCSVDHAESVARLFRENGVSAESICCSSEDAETRQLVVRFRRGDFQVATSVLLLTAPIEAPDCRTVFLARPSENPALISQLIGRVTHGTKVGENPTWHIVDFVDKLNRNCDLAASHFAFVRDNDERICQLVRRPPRHDAQGISVALLLRIREYLNDRSLNAKEPWAHKSVLLEEIAGWFQYWDGEIERVLLVPHKKAQVILAALEAVEKMTKKAEAEYRENIAAEMSRGIFEEYRLDAESISEVDFVSMAIACAKDRSALNFFPLHGQNAIQEDPQKAADAFDAISRVKKDLADAGALAEHKEAFEELRIAIMP
jgi:superfamily II DNA or RNA helicase